MKEDKRRPRIAYCYEFGKNGDRKIIGSLSKCLRSREIDRNRADYTRCRFYDGCLDFAAQKNLESFTCRICPQFEKSKYMNVGASPK